MEVMNKGEGKMDDSPTNNRLFRMIIIPMGLHSTQLFFSFYLVTTDSMFTLINI